MAGHDSVPYGAGMAATKIEIGNKIFLFCQRGTHARRLVITSHGGVKGKFDTPRKLVFYSNLGEAMIDRTIAMIIREGGENSGVVQAGTKNTEDYQLTSYQTERGDGPETFDDLFDEVRRLSQGREEDLWDIVAVRGPTTLSSVLNQLAQAESGRFADYQEVHCSFCRV
jgi:hypothetical protein